MKAFSKLKKINIITNHFNMWFKRRQLGMGMVPL